MRSKRARSRLRLKGAVFALALGAMATQVGGATPAARNAGERAAAPLHAALIPAPGERELRELRACVAGVLRGPHLSGSWALLAAGLTGAWAIGWRRMSALGGRSLDSDHLHRR